MPRSLSGAGAAGLLFAAICRRKLPIISTTSVGLRPMNLALGFVVSFALLTFFVVTFVFRRSPMTAGITAVAAALVFHVVFPVVLEVQLPTGVFGF